MTSISQYKSGKKLLIHCLGEIVKQSTGQLFYAQELTTDRPQYPFFTFVTVAGDHEELADFPDHRNYQIILQLDVHSNDYWQADDLASQLFEALRDPSYKRFLKQCSMTIQTTGDVMSHNAVIGSNYDYAQGFDVTFDLISGLEFDIDKLNFTYSPTTTIDSATITDKNDGYEINNNK
ncbi:phage neck terminator protein [Lentilactobacillus otakiensis]|uniref:phage neck terminator protein n=1 Tax=Lentilactobacillus otakiensis TaxID=481720 RepID=UPI003D16ABAE